MEELAPFPSSFPSSSQDMAHPDAIKSWTQKEKYHLLQGMKDCGRHDIEKIQEYVQTKTVVETKAALEHYTAVARQHPILKKDKEQTEQRPKRSHKSQSPLTDWAKLLTDNISYNELTTETATAVRIMADLEDIPAKECTENIDFRQIYHEIANAMEGKPLTGDKSTVAVLHKCLTETELSSKAFIKTAALRHIKNNINVSEDMFNRIPQPSGDHEVATLRYLASQGRYNPLKIPEEHLKPSSPGDEKKLK